MQFKPIITKIKQYYYRSFITRALFYAIISFLFLRLFSSFVLLIGFFQPSPVTPSSEISREVLFNLENTSFFNKFFLAPWYRWDTTHYLEIADFGYDFNFMNTAWPPLYPFLIKITDSLFSPTILAALIVSNIFFILGLEVFYLLTKEVFSEKMSKDSIFYLIFFPTSFFFVAGYSESIFLFLSIAVFIFLRRKKWLFAGFFCFLATITRVQGLILAIPILYELILEFKVNGNFKIFIFNSISSLYAPFSYGLFSLYVYFGLRYDWPWESLSENWYLHFGFPWDGLIGNIQLLLGKSIENDLSPDLVKLLNLIIAILAIIILFKLRKKIPASISIYGWIMLFVAIGKLDDNNELVSVIRYVLTIFPIFWGFALLIKQKYLKLTYFAVSIVLQIILLVYFYWWYWVA